MSRLTKLLVSVYGAALLSLPLVLFSLGFRDVLLENRRQSQLPDIALGSALQPGFYRALDAYLGDNLPLRRQAIGADAWIDFFVLEDSPQPSQVLVGADRWLFNTNSFLGTCTTLPPVEEVTGNADLLTSVLEAAGKRVALVVVPKKRTVYPNQLGPLAERAACAQEVAALLRRELEAAPPRGYVDVWGLLVASATAGGDLVYWRDDTHWSPTGSLVAAEAIMEALAPGRWQRAEVVDAGHRQRTGDLTRLMGLSFRETFQDWRIQRPGVRVRATEEHVVEGGPEVRRFRARAPRHAQLLAGDALYVGDSYARYNDGYLAPFFEDLVSVNWRLMRNEGECCVFDTRALRRGETWALAEMVTAEYVIVESVEMRFWERFATPRLAYLALDALYGSLSPRDLTAAPTPDGREVLLPPATLSAHEGRPFLVVRAGDVARFDAIAEVRTRPEEGWRPIAQASSLSQTAVLVLDLGNADPGSEHRIAIEGLPSGEALWVRLVWVP